MVQHCITDEETKEAELEDTKYKVHGAI